MKISSRHLQRTFYMLIIFVFIQFSVSTDISNNKPNEKTVKKVLRQSEVNKPGEPITPEQLASATKFATEQMAGSKRNCQYQENKFLPVAIEMIKAFIKQKPSELGTQKCLELISINRGNYVQEMKTWFDTLCEQEADKTGTLKKHAVTDILSKIGVNQVEVDGRKQACLTFMTLNPEEEIKANPTIMTGLQGLFAGMNLNVPDVKMVGGRVTNERETNRMEILPDTFTRINNASRTGNVNISPSELKNQSNSNDPANNPNINNNTNNIQPDGGATPNTNGGVTPNPIPDTNGGGAASDLTNKKKKRRQSALKKK